MVSLSKLILFYFVLFLFQSITILSQSNNAIQKKNSELSKLESQISILEHRLASKSEKEKNSNYALETLNNQTLLLNKLINKIVKDEKAKEKSIKNINIRIQKISKQVEALQNEYAAYITWIYKRNLKPDLSYIFQANSLKQGLLRYKYLHIISDANKNLLDELKSKTNILNKLKLKYKNEIKEKQNLINIKIREKNLLTEKKIQRQKVISQLKNDKAAITKEIEDKRLSELVIKKIIAKLTEEERRRQELLRTERLKNRTITARIDYSYDKYENFGALKGKLNWPVASGKIVRKFGENINARINTVTLNYGIDIGTKKNIQVKAISGGRVSIIDWIPGYGSVIIITHKGNYRTVYGHLTDITVDEGDEIKAGEVLGKVNESLEGNILHFEIWRERNYQNPVKWLVKK